MRFEKSSGAVVFRRFPLGIKFLLLHYSKGHWGFPKGRIEAGESKKQAALREIMEETSLDVKLNGGFCECIEYSFNENGESIRKEAFFFLAESPNGKVRLSSEHTGHKWLPLDGALETLSFENSRGVLRKAFSFIGTRTPEPKNK